MKLPCYSYGWIFGLLIACCLLNLWSVEAVEIKWIPGEDKVPDYSVQDRQNLLRLDQQISSSPNPDAVLAQVAQSGGLEPNKLQEILMENRRYFQEHGGGAIAGGGGGRKLPLTVAVTKAVTSMFVLSWHASLKHPRISMTVFLSLLLASWVAWNAPRNGVLLAIGGGGGGGSGSARPTTLFVPPTHFLEATMLEPEWWVKQNDEEEIERSVTPMDSKDVWRHIDAGRRKQKQNKKKTDGVQWLSDFSTTTTTTTKKRSNILKFSKAATMERVTDMEIIVPQKQSKGGSQAEIDDDDDADDDELKEKYRLYQHILEDQAGLVLLRTRPQLTEFVLSPQKIKFFTAARKNGDDDDDDMQNSATDFGLLMVPGLGKWGAIGFIPCILRSDNNDNYDDDNDRKLRTSDGSVLASLVLSILPGTYWAGQDIYIRIVQPPQQSNAVVQVALVVGNVNNKENETNKLKKKRSKQQQQLLPKKFVNHIVESLCSSLQTSLETRTRQAMARQEQSARFASRAKLSAKERRLSRASRERQIEEMAADRRRRRFQENPDQGRYRPSGERMRSPNNAVYK